MWDWDRLLQTKQWSPPGISSDPRIPSVNTENATMLRNYNAAGITKACHFVSTGCRTDRRNTEALDTKHKHMIDTILHARLAT